MPFEVFNGGAVQNAYVSYQLYSDTADPNPFVSNDLTLIWPNSYQTGNTTAAFMDIEVSGADRSVTLPDARQVSPGTNFIINNKSTTETFDLLDSTLTIIIDNFPESTSYYLILTDNTTEGGTWEKVLFGANTPDFSTVTPGHGLIGPLTGQSANTLNTINTYKNATATLGPTYQMTLDDMGKCLVVNLTAANIQQIRLPLLSSIPAGFYVILRNQLGGSVGVVTAVDDPNNMQINGGSFVLQQGNAITLFYSGVISGGHYQFYTYGSTSLSLPVSLANGGTGINAASTSQLFNYLAPNNSVAAGSMNYSNGTATIGGNLCNTYTNLAPSSIQGTPLIYNKTTNKPQWGGVSTIAYNIYTYDDKNINNLATGEWVSAAGNGEPITIYDSNYKVVINATLNFSMNVPTSVRFVKYPWGTTTYTPFAISEDNEITTIIYPATATGVPMTSYTFYAADTSPTAGTPYGYAIQVKADPTSGNQLYFNTYGSVNDGFSSFIIQVLGGVL